MHVVHQGTVTGADTLAGLSACAEVGLPASAGQSALVPVATGPLGPGSAISK